MVRRITIVGNGGIPKGAADMIDLSDLVIRFNDCRSLGPGGRKTDVVAVCNTGRPGKEMVSGQTWRESSGVRLSSEIWSVRDPGKFSELRMVLAESHPALDDFCDDYSAEFAAIAQADGKTHLIIDRSVHDALDNALRHHDARQYIAPSSGLLAIGHVLTAEEYRGDEILLAGFGHEGWDGHPFAAEKRLVDTWANQGKLKRILGTQFYSPAEGA